MDDNSVDDIINRLLDVRTGRPGKQVQLSEAEIRSLCMTSREIFLQQPVLLELEAPIKICGEGTVQVAAHATLQHLAPSSCLCPLPPAAALPFGQQR